MVLFSMARNTPLQKFVNNLLDRSVDSMLTTFYSICVGLNVKYLLYHNVHGKKCHMGLNLVFLTLSHAFTFINPKILLTIEPEPLFELLSWFEVQLFQRPYRSSNGQVVRIHMKLFSPAFIYPNSSPFLKARNLALRFDTDRLRKDKNESYFVNEFTKSNILTRLLLALHPLKYYSRLWTLN